MAKGVASDIIGRGADTPPALGWRVFALGDDGMLRAPWVNALERHEALADWPEPDITARCLFSEHEAPDPDCPCGVYATQDLHELLAAYGEIGVIARVELSGRVLPGTRIPVDDPPTTLRAARARLVELHLRGDLWPHATALVHRYRGVRLLIYPRSDLVARPGEPRTWQELTAARPIKRQAAREQRLTRRGPVTVNAPTYLIASGMTRFYLELAAELGDAKPTPKACALAFGRAWAWTVKSVEPHGFGRLMAGVPRPAQTDWVTRTLTDEILQELETPWRSSRGDGQRVQVDVRWVDLTVVLLHALEGVCYAGLAPCEAMTDSLGSYVGRARPPGHPAVCTNRAVRSTAVDVLRHQPSEVAA